MENQKPLLLPIVRSQTPVEVAHFFWIAWMVDADRLFHHAVSNNPERERYLATR